MNRTIPNVPLKCFLFLVQHPSLHPPRGILGIVAPDFQTAMKPMANRCPGIHIIRLECEYWMHQAGATA